MKTLAKNIPIILHNREYICDILLGIYVSSSRASIILVDTTENGLSEVVSIASTNAPDEYYTGMSPFAFTCKVWSENLGLWDQLISLIDSSDDPLFLPTGKSFTLGFTKAPVLQLGHSAQLLFLELQEELARAEASNRKAGVVIPLRKPLEE